MLFITSFWERRALHKVARNTLGVMNCERRLSADRTFMVCILLVVVDNMIGYLIHISTL